MFTKDFGYCSGGNPLTYASITGIGFGLVIIGIVLAIVAVAILAFGSAGSGTNTRGAGVILIGPIPIIFGTDKNSVKAVMVLAIILILAVLAMMFIPSLVPR